MMDKKKVCTGLDPVSYLSMSVLAYVNKNLQIQVVKRSPLLLFEQYSG